mmetsp:Transcript_60572/g.179544  ORF Transcript_60572/g.179544 Transcript_60572/m.179544 type:complete len:101 (-) Transcript_60572:335-637(-)
MQTASCARRYPKLLVHSLLINHDIEVPRDVLEESGVVEHRPHAGGCGGGNGLERWICGGGIGRLTFAILAAQDCREGVEEMQKEERQRIVDGEREKVQRR